MGNARWAGLDKGQFHVLKMQCETCIFKKTDPMICEKYPERKPNNVLRCEGECLEYKKK